MDWRWGRGWSDAQIEEHRLGVQELPRNYQAEPAEMTPANGWNFVASEAVIGFAPKGTDTVGVGFSLARRAIETLTFSDPRIVVQHYRKDHPLLGQAVLLELRAVGLHILSAVRVAAERWEPGEKLSVFGICFETCEGHLERGREWFLLTQDHVTGELRFRIEAAWQPGQFPTFWMKWGFHVMGRRYQRAWHRLAHARLREIVKGESAALPSQLAPVQFWANKGLAKGVAAVEHEHEKAPAVEPAGEVAPDAGT